MTNLTVGKVTASNNALRQAEDPVIQAVETIAELHERAERQVDRHQRAVETASTWLGRPAVLYSMLGLVATWITVNLILRGSQGITFDPPPFPWLQAIISLGALVVAMVVLITQNRLAKLTERRSQLDLQIGLMAEQKITKLIALLEELRRDLPAVQDRHDPVAEAMQEPVDAQAVLVALEATLEDTLKDVHLLEAMDSQLSLEP